jgi:hypothetical protein
VDAPSTSRPRNTPFIKRTGRRGTLKLIASASARGLIAYIAGALNAVNRTRSRERQAVFQGGSAGRSIFSSGCSSVRGKARPIRHNGPGGSDFVEEILE